MTLDQIADTSARQLDELYEGYVLIAFTDDGQPVVASRIKDPRTAIALNALMVKVIENGGVGAQD